MNHRFNFNPSQAEMDSAKAIAFVVDLFTSPDQVAMVEKLGGGWISAINFWRGSGLPYMVLAATNEDRVNLTAPKAALAKNVAALEAAMTVICQDISDVPCAWHNYASGEARDVVSRSLLAEVQVGGRA